MSRNFDARQTQTNVFDALVDASRRFGAKKSILEDQERNPLTYLDLIRASFALGRKIAAMTKPGERVGQRQAPRMGEQRAVRLIERGVAENHAPSCPMRRR